MAVTPLLRAEIAAGVLDTYLEAVGAVAEGTRIHFEASGLRSAMTDPADVAQVEAQLGAGAFADYGAPGPEHTPTIGVAIATVRDALGLYDADRTLALAVDGETRALELEPVDGGLECSLGTIDPDTVRRALDDPGLDLPATATIAGRALARPLGAAAIADADHVRLTVRTAPDGAVLSVSTPGTDDDDVDVGLGPDDPGVVEAPALADGADAVSSRFSLAYLEDLLRPVPADAEVDLAVGDGMPAELRWRVGGAAGTVLYRLAPRLDRGR